MIQIIILIVIKIMKLYAKINSERGKEVTKSGNEYIKVDILDRNRNDLITLHLTCAKSNLRGEHYNIYLTNHQHEYIDIQD